MTPHGLELLGLCVAAAIYISMVIVLMRSM